jgi:flagellar basal body-associated protein FliL
MEEQEKARKEIEQAMKKHIQLKRILKILLFFMLYVLIVGILNIAYVLFSNQEPPPILELLMYFANVGAMACGFYTIHANKRRLMKLLGIFIVLINGIHVIKYLV